MIGFHLYLVHDPNISNQDIQPMPTSPVTSSSLHPLQPIFFSFFLSLYSFFPCFFFFFLCFIPIIFLVSIFSISVLCHACPSWLIPFLPHICRQRDPSSSSSLVNLDPLQVSPIPNFIYPTPLLCPLSGQTLLPNNYSKPIP